MVRRFYRHVMNEHRVEPIDRLMAADFIDHGALPGQAPGREGFKQAMQAFLAGFPDLRFSIEDQIAEGDKVVTRFTSCGAHCVGSSRIAATGPVGSSGISIDRIVNGKFVESWLHLGMLGLPRQLSAVPA